MWTYFWGVGSRVKYTILVVFVLYSICFVYLKGKAGTEFSHALCVWISLKISILFRFPLFLKRSGVEKFHGASKSIHRSPTCEANKIRATFWKWSWSGSHDFSVPLSSESSQDSLNISARRDWNAHGWVRMCLCVSDGICSDSQRRA